MLRPYIARLFAPVAFGGDTRTAATLASFARAEAGSRRDLLLAAAATPSADRAALYLRHAQDESRHSVVFADRSRALDRTTGIRAPRTFDADVEGLFDRLGERRFLAFAHLGERRGCAQFEVYRAFLTRRGDTEAAAMFADILVDERRHESYTWALLVELTGGEAVARHAVRRAARWEAWRTFRRLARSTADALFWLAATALYFASAPLWVLVRLVRPERRGFLPPER